MHFITKLFGMPFMRRTAAKGVTLLVFMQRLRVFANLQRPWCAKAQNTKQLKSLPSCKILPTSQSAFCKRATRLMWGRLYAFAQVFVANSPLKRMSLHVGFTKLLLLLPRALSYEISQPTPLLNELTKVILCQNWLLFIIQPQAG